MIDDMSGGRDVQLGEKSVMQNHIEFLEEQRMILTIALNKIKTQAMRPPDIKTTCEVALIEAGDEDYYDD